MRKSVSIKKIGLALALKVTLEFWKYPIFDSSRPYCITRYQKILLVSLLGCTSLLNSTNHTMNFHNFHHVLDIISIHLMHIFASHCFENLLTRNGKKYIKEKLRELRIFFGLSFFAKCCALRANMNNIHEGYRSLQGQN